MSVDFNKDFSLTTKPYSMAVTPVREPVNKDKSETNDNSSYSKLHTARDITIGAVGASLVLVTLGVMARKGVFGKNLQKYLGGLEKDALKGKTHDMKQKSENVSFEENMSGKKSESISPEEKVLGKKSESAQLGEGVQKTNISTEESESLSKNTDISEKQSAAESSQNTSLNSASETSKEPQSTKKPVEQKPTQSYTTTLAQTLKEYKEDDIDIYGIAVGKTFNTRGKTIPSKDMLSKVRNNELTTLYDDKNGITEIILPIGSDFWAVKINGIVSKERAKDIFRTINANGISDPRQFHSIITDVLNGKLNTKYSLKNIGMFYDFHDNGAWKFDGGGGKWCTDGRMMLRENNPQWKGFSIAYYAPPGHRTTTEIGVALPSTGNERSLSNHYSIFLDGVIPSGTVGRLIRHLETDIIKNPKDPKYEELSKIQDAVIKFLNQN